MIDNFITDSAAAATAFACGIKTRNGAVGVDRYNRSCGTILEAAHLQGYLTGMVVTSSVTDATPAAFAAHIPDGSRENEIALQLIGDTPLGRTVDLLFGGGWCHFTPEVERSSCRTDGIDLKALARSRGITFLEPWEFDRHLSDPLPVIGLFHIHVETLPPATIPGRSEEFLINSIWCIRLTTVV